MPTRLEWDGLQLNYKKQLERKLLRAASNPDDLDAANETDEAAAADQKALPTSSHITLYYLFIIIYLYIYIYSCHRFSPLLNWIFNRLYLSIDPISELIFLSDTVSRLRFFRARIALVGLKKNHNLGVLN